MKVHVLGKDDRSNYLRELYADEIANIEDCDYLFCPIPFTRDNIYVNETDIKIDEIIKLTRNKILITGSLNEKIISKFNEKEIKYIDILSYEEFSILNAEATSEGALKKVIEMSKKTINDSVVLILGFGRIGKSLANNFRGFTSKIYVEARKEKDIALIKTMGYNEVDLNDLDNVVDKADIIINTIPALILDKKRLDALKKDVCILDLASAPGGVDFEYARKLNLNVCWYLGIPSKDFPLSAAMYIKSTTDKILRGERIWEKKST